MDDSLTMPNAEEMAKGMEKLEKRVFMGHREICKGRG